MGGDLGEGQMDKEARVAYIISQAASAMITAMGMQAENEQRKHLDQSMAYQEDAFLKVIRDHGIGCNDVVAYLRD